MKLALNHHVCDCAVPITGDTKVQESLKSPENLCIGRNHYSTNKTKVKLI